MLNGKPKGRVLEAGTLVTLFALFAAAAANATDTPNLRGQWIGNSMIEGQRDKAKTSLSLGAADDAENATLRIEDSNACTLKQGKYSAQPGTDGALAWSLSFKEAHGGEVCERLAQGNFLLRQGSGARQLLFDVTYPGRDGTQNHRIGALSRYP